MTDSSDSTNVLEVRLTPGDVTRAFELPGNPYPPILSLKEAAQLAWHRAVHAQAAGERRSVR